MFVRDIKSNEALSFSLRSFAVSMAADGYSDFRAKRLLYGIVADSRVNLNIYPQTNLNSAARVIRKMRSRVR